MEKKKKKNDENSSEASIAVEDGLLHVSAIEATFTHLICGLGLAIALWLAQSVESIDFISDLSRTLRLISVIECPIVILLYSRLRKNPDQSSVRIIELSRCCRTRCPGITDWLVLHLAPFSLLKAWNFRKLLIASSTNCHEAMANDLGAIALGALLDFSS